jgi:hypothetical protein
LVHNNKIPIAPPLLRFPTDFDEKLPLVVYLCARNMCLGLFVLKKNELTQPCMYAVVACLVAGFYCVFHGFRQA